MKAFKNKYVFQIFLRHPDWEPLTYRENNVIEDDFV
jgi:hypothetical protein